MDDGHGGQQHGVGCQLAQIGGKGCPPQIGRVLPGLVECHPPQFCLGRVPRADKAADLVLIEGRQRVGREARQHGPACVRANA